MSNNIHLPKDFYKTQNFENYSYAVQTILDKIMTALDSKDIAYVVKVGKGRNEIITLSLENRPSTNIASIYVHREHVRIRLNRDLEYKITLEDDVTDIVIDILDKHNELMRSRRQCSIYVYADTVDKIDEIAKQSGKSSNEIIELFLNERTAGLFLSQRHKLEFVRLLKQADMFSDSINYSNPKNLQRLAIFYLLSAYQNEYKQDTGEKFSIVRSGDELSFRGPIHLFSEWELGYKESETIIGLVLFIKNGSGNSHGLLDILQDMAVNDIYYYAENVFKILSWMYEIDTSSCDVLVARKKIVLSADEVPDFTL